MLINMWQWTMDTVASITGQNNTFKLAMIFSMTFIVENLVNRTRTLGEMYSNASELAVGPRLILILIRDQVSDDHVEHLLA